MYIIHEATIHQPEGIIDVHIIIVNHSDKKSYVYHIKSAWAVGKFMTFYKKGKKFHGRALTYLNNFKIKEEREK